MKTEVTYLEHSGFFVELDRAYLLFDYYQGQIPTLDVKKDVYVFVSHSHHDHYNQAIFELRDLANQVFYVLSDDIQIAATDDITLVAANQSYQIGDCSIKTYRSTDLGVAFLITYEGKHYYHAGDLNWWHWNGEPEAFNHQMQVGYQSEIDSIAADLATDTTNDQIEIAFVPTDPRLEDKYLWALEYLCQKITIHYIFPMHLWGKYEVLDWIAEDEMAKPFRERVQNVRRPGQLFCLED